MIEDKEYEVIDCMQKYGGSFVKALAECLIRADPINYKKLKDAFTDYFLQYKGMANLQNEKK